MAPSSWVQLMPAAGQASQEVLEGSSENEVGEQGSHDVLSRETTCGRGRVQVKFPERAERKAIIPGLQSPTSPT